MEEFVQEYGLLCGVCALVGMTLFWIVHFDPDRRRERLRRLRGKRMEEARKLFLLGRLADYITDGADDDLWGSQITSTERRWLFSESAKRLGLRDLAPRNGRISLGLLKKEIKHRLDSNKYYRDCEGNRHKIIIFPDCPGWTVTHRS